MDPVKKRTLDLIEASVSKLEYRERGRQLMFVARDYAEDGDLVEVRRVLRTVEARFYDVLPQVAAADPDLRLAVASFIDALGMDWIVWVAKPRDVA